MPIQPLTDTASTAWVEELSGEPSPWQACRKLSGLRSLLFLDSAGGPPRLRKWSYITGDPFLVIRSAGRDVCIEHRQPELRAERLVADPFDVLEYHVSLFRADRPGNFELPTFWGGAAGVLGYELGHHIERLPQVPGHPLLPPEMIVGFYDWVLAFDHDQHRTLLISTGLPANDPVHRRQRAVRRADQVKWMLEKPVGEADDASLQPPSSWDVPPWPCFRIPGSDAYSNFSREAYLRAVERAVQYIHAGDCFQVNLSQQLWLRVGAGPLRLYERLRRTNAAPFAAFMDLDDGRYLLSSSPERFLRLEDGVVTTCPIKGTRPRGITPEEDAAQAALLRQSEKDRAENVMIVDLLRNDLGRVCAYGSIDVSGLCRLESYRHVHHLVSEVTGRLGPGKGPIDLLRASFPGGSITGAPKIRAMEIIAELEGVRRGPYCGSLVALAWSGDMDSSLLIRTCTVSQGWAIAPVGGGIVADSDPQQEYEETWHKARGIVRALAD